MRGLITHKARMALDWPFIRESTVLAICWIMVVLLVLLLMLSLDTVVGPLLLALADACWLSADFSKAFRAPAASMGEPVVDVLLVAASRDFLGIFRIVFLRSLCEWPPEAGLATLTVTVVGAGEAGADVVVGAAVVVGTAVVVLAEEVGAAVVGVGVVGRFLTWMTLWIPLFWVLLT